MLCVRAIGCYDQGLSLVGVHRMSCRLLGLSWPTVSSSLCGLSDFVRFSSMRRMLLIRLIWAALFFWIFAIACVSWFSIAFLRLSSLSQICRIESLIFWMVVVNSFVDVRELVALDILTTDAHELEGELP